MSTARPLQLGASEYRAVHGLACVQTALAEHDDYRTAADGLRLLAAAPTQPAHEDDAPTALADLITEAVTSGRPVPDDITDRAQALVKSSEATQAVRQAINLAQARLTGQLDNALRTGWNTILRHLNGELATVLDKARDLGNVHQLRTAEAAITADRAGDYQTWRTLLATMARLRTDQATITRQAGIVDAGEMTEVLFFRHPDHAYDQWKPWRTHGYLEDRATGTRQMLTPPWPTTDQGWLTADTAGTEEFLTWALANDVHLWIPTRSQLKAEADRLNKVLQSNAVRSRATEHTNPTADQTFTDPNDTGRRKVKAVR